MSVGKAIFGILNGTVAVTNITGTNNIYPQRVKQSATMPAISYDYVDNNPVNDKDGVSKLDTIIVDVDSWTDSESGDGYSDCVALAAVVRTALDRFSGTNTGVVIQSIRFDSEQHLFEDSSKVYHISQQYSIRQTI